MFDDIGGKIKIIGQIFCWVGIACAVIAGALCIAYGQTVSGLLIAMVGSLVAWISSIMIYGFGQLVQNSDIIAENTDCLVDKKEYEE